MGLGVGKAKTKTRKGAAAVTSDSPREGSKNGKRTARSQGVWEDLGPAYEAYRRVTQGSRPARGRKEEGNRPPRTPDPAPAPPRQESRVEEPHWLVHSKFFPWIVWLAIFAYLGFVFWLGIQADRALQEIITNGIGQQRRNEVMIPDQHRTLSEKALEEVLAEYRAGWRARHPSSPAAEIDYFSEEDVAEYARLYKERLRQEAGSQSGHR